MCSMIFLPCLSESNHVVGWVDIKRLWFGASKAFQSASSGRTHHDGLVLVLVFLFIVVILDLGSTTICCISRTVFEGRAWPLAFRKIS